MAEGEPEAEGGPRSDLTHRSVGRPPAVSEFERGHSRMIRVITPCAVVHFSPVLSLADTGFLRMNLPVDDNAVAAKPAFTSNTGTGRPLLSLGVHELACSRNDRVLFSRLGFQVDAGQMLIIEGANGSGKTTLLKTLCGFIVPDEGEVLWCGTDIRACMDDYLGGMHYVGHNNGIKAGLSCAENLNLACVLAASAGPVDIAGILRQYGLEQYTDTPAQMLSSGQRRRLALARLSVSEAGGIWILDEPYTSLDEKGKGYMRGVFSIHLERGGIIVVTSHEPLGLSAVNPLTVSL